MWSGPGPRGAERGGPGTRQPCASGSANPTARLSRNPRLQPALPRSWVKEHRFGKVLHQPRWILPSRKQTEHSFPRRRRASTGEKPRLGPRYPDTWGVSQRHPLRGVRLLAHPWPEPSAQASHTPVAFMRKSFPQKLIVTHRKIIWATNQSVFPLPTCLAHQARRGTLRLSGE